MFRNKLKSNTGASITIALLLFLVCAVVGAVVLTAATAASGRTSDMAEADQRYFSVTSAAALLEKELDGKPVTIRREEIYTSTVTTTYGTQDILDGDDNKIGEEPTVTVVGPVPVQPYPDYKAYVDENEYPTSTSLSFLQQEAAYLLFGGATSLSAETMSYTFNHGKEQPFTLEPTEDLTDDDNFLKNSELKITGTVTLRTDGALEFNFRNIANDGTDENSYRMRMVLTPAIAETEETTSNTVTEGDVETTTVTTAKIATIKWTVSSIEVGNA